MLIVLQYSTLPVSGADPLLTIWQMGGVVVSSVAPGFDVLMAIMALDLDAGRLESAVT